jgi:hypothetical protein
MEYVETKKKRDNEAATQDSLEHGTDNRTNERSTLTEMRSGLVNACLYRSFNDLRAAGGRG